MTSSILLISGDAALRATIRDMVEAKGQCRLEAFDCAKAGLAHARSVPVSLALVHRAHSEQGIETACFLRELTSDAAAPPTIVLCEDGNLEAAVQLMKLGAAECMHAPLNLNRLSLLIDMAVARDRLRPRTEPETIVADTDNGGETKAPGFLFHSPAMRTLLQKARHVARLDTTILITGETGTGKTQLSRLVHHFSPRRSDPFLAVNCGALSPTLIESELFGHSRGAFTGADRDHTGKFAHAKVGTLLLDELDALPLSSQAKLLRAVDERVFEPIGSNRTQRVQARLIVATNKSLEDEVSAGRFRADLFYRLNVIRFQLPALRSRRDEIRPLAKYYFKHFVEKHGVMVQDISEDALDALTDYDWPGNVRELRNVMERAVILCSGDVIDLAALGEEISSRAPRRHNEETPAESGRNRLACAKANAEREELLRILRQNKNNRALTAQKLGISRTALYKKLRRHNLS